MTHHPHQATPHSAAALARLELGATGVIVVKCKDWPDGWTPKGIGLFHPTRIDKHGEEYSGAEVFGAWDEDRAVICPYKPGDVVGIKERYRIYGTGYGGPLSDIRFHVSIEYPDGETACWEVPQEVYAKYDTLFEQQPERDDYWCPARSMPPWAVRTHLRVESIACKRLQEVTEEECRLYGATHDGWNTERQVFQSQLKAAWSANSWHWFITAEKCNNTKGAT